MNWKESDVPKSRPEAAEKGAAYQYTLATEKNAGQPAEPTNGDSDAKYADHPFISPSLILGAGLPEMANGRDTERSDPKANGVTSPGEQRTLCAYMAMGLAA